MLKPKRQQSNKVNSNYMQMYCLQSWFISSSWLEKLSLAKEFVNNTDIDLLRTLLHALTPEYIKSVCYRNCQTENNFAVDIVPQDTNRMLSPSVLHLAQKDAISWYTSLDSKLHLNVILAMILLGGPAFTSHLMSYIKDIYCQRTLHSAEHLSKVEEPKQVDVPASEAISTKGKKKKGRKSRVSEKSSKKSLDKRKASIDVSEQPEESKSMSTQNVFINEEVEEFLDIWNKELDMLKNAHKDDEEEGKPKTSKGKDKKKRLSKSKKQPDVVDQVQILPFWVNRAILKYLNNKDLMSVKNVNPYWSNMVDNLKKEQAARAAINRTLQKMTNEPVIKSETIVEKKKPAKSARSSKSAKSNKTRKSQQKLTRSTIVDNEVLNDPPEPTGLPDTDDTTKGQEFSNVIFPKYIIPTRFSDISSSCHPAGRLLAVPRGRDIELYSLRVGNILPITFHGHIARVTAVRFHDGGDLLSASCDKTIRRWSLCNRTPLLVYQGHTESVVTLSVTRHHVASAALNSIVKVFHMDGGYCMWTMEWLSNVPTFLQLSDCGALYISSEKGYMAAYNIHKQNPTENVIAHKSRVNCLLLDGELLFSCGNDSYVRLWNSSDIEKPMAAMAHDGKPVTCMCLSGNVLISGCLDGSLYLWNIKTAVLLRTFRGEFRELHSVHSFKAIDHIKVILHFDCQIQILEFPAIEPHDGSKVNYLNKVDQANAKNKRIKTLATRCCTKKSLLKLKRKRYETDYPPIILEAAKQTEGLAKNLCVFPRYS